MPGPVCISGVGRCYIPRPMSTVKTIAVIGAGTMGSGIALTAAQTGFSAIQIDVSQAALDKAKAGHAKSLARLVVGYSVSLVAGVGLGVALEYLMALGMQNVAAHERGLHPLDPDLGIDWGLKPEDCVLSAKDAQQPLWKDYQP